MFFLEKFLFKQKCLSCGRFSEKGLCTGCINQFQDLPHFVCKVCKSNNLKNDLCLECQGKTRLFNNLSATYVYNGLLKTLLYNVKYEGQKEVLTPLGSLLAKGIKEEFNTKEITLITSIPIHKEKLKLRKFNQAEIIARAVAKDLKIPYYEVFERVKNTKPQFSLSSKEREENLKDSFEVIYNKDLANKSVLLIDDIFTTGTTINEACKILLEEKVNKIYIGVLARSFT